MGTAVTIFSELHYLPCIALFKQGCNADIWLINENEPYQKMSFRNRCIIYGANGLIPLSIPIKNGRNQRIPIKEIEINSTENWGAHHIKSIQSAYSKAPYFEYFWPTIRQVYQQECKYLFDFNFTMLSVLLKICKSKVSVNLSQNALEPTINLYNQYKPNNYSLQQPVPIYFQLFAHKHQFKHNLSVLDYLFCEGNKI